MTKKAAIPKDVAEQEKPKLDEHGNPIVVEIATPKLDRDVMMDEMAEKRKLQQQGITEEPLDQNDDDDPVPGSEEPGDKEVVTPPAEDVVDEMVTLRVNGQDIKKTKAEVDAAGGVAAIQKSLAGDVKLAQAAEERRLIGEEREQLAQERGQLQTLIEQQKTQGVEDTPEAKEARKAKAKTIAEKFFAGDAAELETAVESLLEAGQVRTAPAPAAPQINEEAVARKAADLVEFKTEQKVAIAGFAENHADLNEVEGRRDYVDQKTMEVMNEHPNWRPGQVIDEAVKRTRTDLNLPAPDAAKDQGGLEAKKQRKRDTADRIPTAHRRQEPPPEKKPKTPAEIFKEMTANRSHGPGS